MERLDKATTMRKLTTKLLLTMAIFLGFATTTMASPSLAGAGFGLVVKAGVYAVDLKIDFGKPSISKSTGNNITTADWNASKELEVKQNQTNATYQTNALTMMAIKPVPPFSQMNGTVIVPATVKIKLPIGLWFSYPGALTVVVKDGEVVTSSVSFHSEGHCTYSMTNASSTHSAYGTITCGQ